MDVLSGGELRRAVVLGSVTDVQFDAIFPARIEAASRCYWTPMRVARSASELLARHGARNVLDVGSGAGKFCLVNACLAPGIQFTGVEQRPSLVRAATDAARLLSLDNVEFRLGDATTVDWHLYDAFYFFNPFAENSFPIEDQFDDTVELSRRKEHADVERVESGLLRAPIGACVLTYHGFGGRIPACYELADEVESGLSVVRAWRKRTDGHPEDGYWLELPEGGTTRYEESSAERRVLRAVRAAAVDADGAEEV